MGIDATWSDVASFDGTRLAWTAAGERSGAPAVVLANGIVCTDTYWTYLFPDLVAAGRRVVCWDYRAHGRSAQPANPNEVSLTAHARDLWAVADAAGVDRAVLVGHSMGVQTTLEAYRLAPERVAGLVAVAGPFEHPGRSFYGTALMEQLLPLVEMGVTPLPAVTATVWRQMTRLPDLLYWSGRASRMIGAQAPRELMDEYFAHLSTLDPQVCFRMVRAMEDHSARDLLPEIEAPTLVLAGGRDVMTPPRLAEAMADAIPDARLAILPDGAHTLPIDEPDEVNRLIGEFVAEVAASPSA